MHGVCMVAVMLTVKHTLTRTKLIARLSLRGLLGSRAQVALTLCRFGVLQSITRCYARRLRAWTTPDERAQGT
jgi:hypothetical protein